MGNKNSVRGKKCLASEIARNALFDQGKHGLESSSKEERPPLVNGDAHFESCEDENKKPSTKLTSPTSKQVNEAMYTVASQNKIG